MLAKYYDLRSANKLPLPEITFIPLQEIIFEVPLSNFYLFHVPGSIKQVPFCHFLYTIANFFRFHIHLYPILTSLPFIQVQRQSYIGGSFYLHASTACLSPTC